MHEQLDVLLANAECHAILVNALGDHGGMLHANGDGFADQYDLAQSSAPLAMSGRCAASSSAGQEKSLSAKGDQCGLYAVSKPALLDRKEDHMTTKPNPQTSAEVNPSDSLDAVGEIRLSMLGQETAFDPGSPEALSFAAVQNFHQHLVRRGWAFESAESLVIWHWPPSRIEEDGYSVLTTDVWIDVEDAETGPEQLRVNISLVGEKDDGRGTWTLEFELSNFDELPLGQAEAFRVGKSLPVPWGGSNSETVTIPDEVASLLRELYRPEAAEAWLYVRNSHLAGGRPIDFLELGHVAVVVYALNVEIKGGTA